MQFGLEKVIKLIYLQPFSSKENNEKSFLNTESTSTIEYFLYSSENLVYGRFLLPVALATPWFIHIFFYF